MFPRVEKPSNSTTKQKNIHSKFCFVMTGEVNKNAFGYFLEKLLEMKNYF